MRWMLVVAVLMGLLVTPGRAAVLCAKKSGALKLRETCKAKETTVDAAALGLQGPPGADGPAGATGPSEVILTEVEQVTGFENTFTPVATLALEPGNYLILGKVWVTDYSNFGFQEYNCRLLLGGDHDNPLDSAAETLGQDPGIGIHSGTLVVKNTLTLTETAVVDVRCANNGGDQSSALKVRLMAIRTGGITVQ